MPKPSVTFAGVPPSIGTFHNVPDTPDSKCSYTTHLPSGENWGQLLSELTGGQLNGIAAIAVHAPNLKNARAIGMENDKTIVGRYCGRVVAFHSGRQLSATRTIRRYFVN